MRSIATKLSLAAALILACALAPAQQQLNLGSQVRGTLSPANGGSGVSNNSAATTTRSGNYPLTQTLTGSTSVTYPTTGTLSTLAGSETLSNKTLAGPVVSTHAELAPQGAAPATPSSGLRLYGDSTGRLSWKRSDGYVRTFDSTLTADRTYTLPDANGTLHTGSVRFIPVSSSEFHVQQPVRNAQSPNIVADYQFKMQGVTSVWWRSMVTVKDRDGVQADVAIGAQDSVSGYAMQVGDHANTYPTGFGFFGEGHASELRTALTMECDGVAITPTSAERTCVKLTIKQSMNHLKPVTGATTAAGTLIGTGTTTHTLAGTTLTYDHTHTFTLPNLDGRSVYAAMLSGDNVLNNRSQAGSEASGAAISASGTVTETGKTDAFFQMYHTDPSVNPYRLKMTLPWGRPELSTSWASVSSPKAFFEDRVNPGGYGKWYAPIVGDTQASISGANWTMRQIYEVIDGRQRLDEQFALTAGSIDGAVIGATTPAAISGTTVSATTSYGFSGTPYLFLDTANRLTMRNSTNRQEICAAESSDASGTTSSLICMGSATGVQRIYTTSTSGGINRALVLESTGTGAAAEVRLKNGATEWWILDSAGQFRPGIDNNNDLGTTAKRVRTGYFSANVSTPQVTMASGTEPTCNSTNRGALVHVYGGVGVKDTVRICAKDAADAYAYRTIY